MVLKYQVQVVQNSHLFLKENVLFLLFWFYLGFLGNFGPIEVLSPLKEIPDVAEALGHAKSRLHAHACTYIC